MNLRVSSLFVWLLPYAGLQWCILWPTQANNYHFYVRKPTKTNQTKWVIIEHFPVEEQSGLLESRQGADAHGRHEFVQVLLVLNELSGCVSHLRVVLLPNIIHEDDKDDGTQHKAKYFQDFEQVFEPGSGCQAFHCDDECLERKKNVKWFFWRGRGG